MRFSSNVSSNHPNRLSRVALLAGAAAIALALAPAAEANVFNAADWTSSGPGTTTVTTTASTVTLNFVSPHGFCAGCSGPTWDFSTVAPTSGVFGFDVKETADGGYYRTSGYLKFFDVTQGTSQVLNTNGNHFTVFNTGSLSVTVGDTLTIEAQLKNFDSQLDVGGTVILSSFVGVPEPVSLALLGVGLVGVTAARRRKV